MPVVNYSFRYDGPVQADGTRQVVETHECAGKPDVVITYFAPAEDFDPSTVLADRAQQINKQLAREEFLQVFGTDAPPVLTEQSLVAFLERLWADYHGSGSDAVNSCKVAWWLLRRIAAGDIADTDCQQAAFNTMGVDAATWDNFKDTTLVAQSNAWAAVLTATGA